MHASADVWLLPKAPTDPDAAINMNKAIHFALCRDIDSIALISEACRNIDPSIGANAVGGSNGFPHPTGQAGNTNVDDFKATAAGGVTWEAKIDGEDRSVLTHA